MQEEKNRFKREAAKKTSVGQVLASSFVENGDGMAAGINGIATMRVNILATIVGKGMSEGPYRSMLADDGTGQIQLRFFGSEGLEGELFEKQGVGSLALVIGKLRQYGEQVYISPEIIRPINNAKWVEVRRLELEAQAGKSSNMAEQRPVAVPDRDVVGKDKMEIYSLIKQLDSGRGADIGEVAAKSTSANAGAIIREMVKSGDLFEFLPGKLKVLD